MAQGGLDGRRPSRNHPILVLFAGKAGKEHEKKEILGRPGTLWVSPQTPPLCKSYKMKRTSK
jgi:hypothetical protein